MENLKEVRKLELTAIRQAVLSGAAKKRFYKFRNQGKSIGDAILLCDSYQNTVLVNSKTKFRPRALKRPNEDEFTRSAKATKYLSLNPVHTPIRIGITDTKNRLLSKKELEAIERAISNEIFNSSNQSGLGPQFVSCHTRQGWLMIECANIHTQDWLNCRMAAIKPWEGADLKILDEKDFPRTYVADAWISDELISTDTLLSLLKYQNPDLGVSNWKISDHKGQVVTFLFGIDSYIELEKKQFQVFLNVGRIVIKVRGHKPCTEDEESVKSSTESMSPDGHSDIPI